MPHGNAAGLQWRLASCRIGPDDGGVVDRRRRGHNASSGSNSPGNRASIRGRSAGQHAAQRFVRGSGHRGDLLALALVYATRRRWMTHPAIKMSSPTSLRAAPDIPCYRVSPAWKTGIVPAVWITFWRGLGSVGTRVVASETRDSPLGLTLVFCLTLLQPERRLSAGHADIDAATSSDRLQIQDCGACAASAAKTYRPSQVLRPPNSPAVLVLQLKPPARRIKLPSFGNTDSAWESWFSKIPDVDAEAANHSKPLSAPI